MMALHIEVFKKSNYSLTDTCGFLIYRDINKIEYLTYCFDYDYCIRNRLKECVLEEIRSGYIHFIVELGYMISEVLADVISELIEDYPQVILEVLTHKSEIEKYKETDTILSKCTKITALRIKDINHYKIQRFEKIVKISGHIIYASSIVMCQYRNCKASHKD